jgi:multisubunit Na+/H+ antiporter MnhG subunit
VETLGKALLVGAIVLALAGGVVLLLARLGISRFPGDVVVRGKNVTVYAPVGLMIVLSLVLTLVLNIFWRR